MNDNSRDIFSSQLCLVNCCHWDFLLRIISALGSTCAELLGAALPLPMSIQTQLPCHSRSDGVKPVMAKPGTSAAASVAFAALAALSTWPG